MGDITINQIIAGIGLIVALGAGGWKLWDGFKKAVDNAVKEQFASISGQIADMSKKINSIDENITKVDMEGCKNFLVRCLADVERGQQMSETEAHRFCEQYDHYIKCGGNTYIKEKHDKLKAAGKL